ncbi:ATP-binding protein [Tolypothrix sp. FACHB-123]|uniref:ATP-binding protein n=1 Tax=Tolypothrix sp. FACHB-123 TaxID=2692868 RepID=UPI001689A1EC|nr:ATP-binding protein [Tolypothrix sp. FACHB-123]MBD2357563.1 ATP-binding protein [Tolypothrix sp. FACHB-123]
MKDMQRWQTANEEYLSAAVKWIRLRLQQMVDIEQVSPAEIAQAQAAMTEAENIQTPPALVLLAQRFGLSQFEQNLLLLCAAIELDTRIAKLCAAAQDDRNRPYPTFALAFACLDEPAWDVLSPERPLRYWRLIEINQPPAQPLTTSALRADERIVNHIKGLTYLDDRLAPLLVPLETAESDIALPPSQEKLAIALIQQLKHSTYWRSPPVIQLLGADSLSKQLVAQQTSAALGLHLYRLPVELLPTQASELEIFARLWHRETLLLPIALYLDANEIETASSTQGLASPLHRFLSRSHTLIFLDTREPRQRLGRTHINIDVAKPTANEQVTAWKSLLTEVADNTSQLLAGQFNLNSVTIEQISRQVVNETTDNSAIQNPKSKIQNQIWDACLSITRPQLDNLAQRIDVKATWDDIVLPKEEINLLHQIADQVRSRHQVYEDWGFHQRMNRGMGISALFAGESGVGKTMGAEVIAHDLSLHLYRIDLSSVVSKYIGETEKNLRRLFDAAEDGGAILFFDEADALFGKRSEVKDSHDRYANIEINYLLQRIEAYRGLAILATNMKSTLDVAFMRRLRFIVNFPFPNPKERKLIWQKAFPPETPIENLDFHRLSQFNLAGGSIHNIVLNAAFMAASTKTAVTMPIVLAATRMEYRKLERPINEVDFRTSEPTEAII